MKLEETKMQVDYLKLSELYAGFLASLGGVSITVLTLVLTLYPKPVAGNLSRFWVGALFVATISCFTGAHLMAEAAAFMNKFIGDNNKLMLGARLSLLASINIYVAAILLIFTIVLLTAEHVKWISVLVFVLVLLITLIWMYYTASSRFVPKHPQAKKAALWAAITGLIVGIVMFIWAMSRLFEEYLLVVSFVIPIVATAFSFCYFVRILKSGKQDWNLNVWLYSFAIALPCVSLFGAGVGLVLR